jgi:hypothetical protein
MLKSLYGMVRESIEKLPGWPDVPTLLLVDDLSILTSIGYPSFDVAMFAHYLQSLVCSCKANKSGCLVCLVHTGACSAYDNTPLHSIVGHQSDMIVSVQPLRTGYCRDLNGEVSTFQSSCKNSNESFIMYRMYLVFVLATVPVDGLLASLCAVQLKSPAASIIG